MKRSLWPVLVLVLGPSAALAADGQDRPPDFLLVTKKCTSLSSKAGKAPLKLRTLPGKTESCWRSGAEVTCRAGDSPMQLRVSRETGPRLFLSGEGGLNMIEIDWTTSSFVNGITFFSDEDGITHVQCAGRAQAGK